MSDEEKLLWMFEQVHGILSKNCKIEIEFEYHKPSGINVLKDGQLCWSVTKTDLMFDYLTKHLA